MKEEMVKMPRSQGKKVMRAELKDAKEGAPPAPVAPARSLREEILRMSLFPNIYNRRTLLGEC